MRAHELKPITTPSRKRRRKGRGISAGQGKTAGRGTKGQNSRSGGGVKPWFEGGQNPLIHRIPKLPGFTSRRTPKQTVTLRDLNRISATTITNQTLKEHGITAKIFQPVKVVATGELSTAKTIRLQAASKRAKSLIEKAGGSFIETPLKPAAGKESKLSSSPSIQSKPKTRKKKST